METLFAAQWTSQLPGQLPWYVGGPLIGLVVAAMYAAWNEPLGVSGCYARLARLARRRPDTDYMRVWVFAGIVVGALLAALLQRGPRLTTAYGALGLALP